MRGRVPLYCGFLLGLALSIVSAVLPSSAQSAETIRVGVLKFGTVNWELDTVIRHKFDEAHGVKLELVELASNDAGRIAVQSGAVDVIVSDWLFVSRQRAEGMPLTFVPYSTSIGAVMVPRDSPVKTLADLKGKRIGVAGGPLDKTWLMLRGLAEKSYGFDLAEEAEPAYGAPPLLAEKLRQGELDAVLNYWHYNARLEAEGYRLLIGGQEAAHALGAEGDISAIGYVFSETWANAHLDAALGFVKASRDAKALLASSDQEWTNVRPLMNAEDDAVFETLVRRYREGIPSRPLAEEERDTAKVYAFLSKIGGEDLVGSAAEMTEGTFWAALKNGS
jgi:NitT/TauT family transport system substrate-binding protein